MLSFRRSLTGLAIFLAPLGLFAREYHARTLPYTDAPSDRSTAIAISVLTEAGILEGNPDRTFRPDTPLNRAEFVKIVMGLVQDQPEVTSLRCFPDVTADAWYAEPVCQAREMGLISGNAIVGVPPAQWRFEPARDVQYVEALKILTLLFHVPTPTPQVGQEWYRPYLSAAIDAGIDLPEAPTPDHRLTRGQMARLVVRFVAWSEGEFDELLAAEARRTDPPLGGSSSSSAAPSSVSSSSSGSTTSASSASSSAASSFTPAQYDDDTDKTVRNNFLLLGTESPVLGLATVRSDAQPVRITAFIVRLKQTVFSMESMNIYDAEGGLLGTAYLDATQPGNRQYILPIKKENIVVPKDVDYQFYARGNMKSQQSGGQSGENGQIDKMGIEYEGVWNSVTTTEFSDDTFPALFQTAAGMLSDISNGGPMESVVVPGVQVRLGSFLIRGRRAPQTQTLDLLLKTLRISVNASGGVNVSNPKLGFDGVTQRHDCTFTNTILVTCSDLPEELASFEQADRTVTLYGDVTISGGANNPKLQLVINEPGAPLQSGDVQWTDGSANFFWVPDTWPVAESTLYN